MGYFSEIKDLLEENGLNKNEVDAVICVRSALYGCEYTTEEFELLCSAVIDVSQHMELCCTQEIADVVCDLYKGLGYGFRDEEYEGIYGDTYDFADDSCYDNRIKLTRTLSMDQLKDLDYRVRDMILDIVWESINNSL